MAPGLVESASFPSTLMDNFPASKNRFQASQHEHEDSYGHYRPADPASLKLESNFGPMDSDSVGYLQPTSADAPLAVLHERFQRDGYLFVCAHEQFDSYALLTLSPLIDERHPSEEASS